jgi:hypothetical protein
MSAFRCTSLLEDGDRGRRVEEGAELKFGARTKFLAFFFGGTFLFFKDGVKLRNGLLTASDYRGAWRVEENEKIKKGEMVGGRKDGTRDRRRCGDLSSDLSSVDTGC